MKVAFLYDNPILENKGGVQRVTSILSNYFDNHNIEVFYISINSNNIQEDNSRQCFLPDNANTLSVENVNFLERFITNNNIDFLINQSGHNYEVTKLLVNLKRKNNIKIISVIHCSLLAPIKNFYETHVAKAKKKKIAFVFSLFKNKSIKKIHLTLHITRIKKQYQDLYKISEVIVSLTRAGLQELEQILSVKSDSRIRVIPNPLNISSNFIKQEFPKQLLFVGNVNTNFKRTDLLIKIWEKVSKQKGDWNLRILGDGEAMNSLKKYVDERRVNNVFFEGNTKPEPFYEKSSIICSTSTSEGLSMVILEGISYGLVPIAFDSYLGIKDIIEHNKNGILVEAFDVQSYATKLISLMSDEEEMKRLSKNAEIKSYDFDIENVGNKWLNIFNELYK